MAATTPLLWQIKLSHYNEKVRWALDYKRVPHRRRAPFPLIGTLPTALVLTGGITTPILQMDGRAIGDSTRIIAALEERHPEPALYPADPAERERALALEEFFDEQVAPQVRIVLWHEMMKSSDTFVATAMPEAGPAYAAVLRAIAPAAIQTVKLRYNIDEAAAAQARRQTVAGMQRLESEIGPAGYLVGDTFSVADLTAASLFTPLVAPPERPHQVEFEFPVAMREFCDQLEAMDGADWIRAIYRRHRSAPVASGAGLTAAAAR